MSDLHKRTVSGIIMGLIAIVAFSIYDGIPFRYFYGLVGILALIELWANFQRSQTASIYVVVESLLTVLGTTAICLYFSRGATIAILAIALINDAGAYFIGKLLHGKFSTGRPFPKTSPNKSWEGLVGGAIFGILACIVCNQLGLLPSHNAAFVVVFTLTAWIVAVFGDWFESRTKRKLQIKDSGDILRDHPILKCTEFITEGHGGFLDRIDSVNAVAIFCFILLHIL